MSDLHRSGFHSLRGRFDWDHLPLRLFARGNAKFWNPADIDFSQDARDWAELVLLMDPDNNNALYNVACGMAQAGEADLAFELLARSTTTVGLEGLQNIRADTDWDPLRDDPRFSALLEAAARRLGLEPASA